MPQVPGQRYPVILLWDYIYNDILLADDWIKTQTVRTVAGDYSITQNPLDKDTIIWSDNNYAVGIAYFLQKEIELNNSMRISKPIFELDVAARHEDFSTAVRNLEKFITDIEYTVQLQQDCNGYGHIRTEEVVPRQAVRDAQMFVVMATLTYSVQIHGQYRV